MNPSHRKTLTDGGASLSGGATALAPSGISGVLRRFMAGRWYPPAVLLLLAGLAWILYGHTLPFPFVFDDCVYLTENPFAFGERRFGFLTDLRGFATAPSEMGMDPDYALNIILRPFAYFTFYLNYLWGGLDPRGFRFVNILIHVANGWLLFLILRHFLCCSSKYESVTESSRLFIPVTAALLFVAHPLQTESVTYVIQRFTSMGAFFCLLALWLHLLANAASGKGGRLALRAASLVAVVLGMLSKESVVTAPVMIVLLDWVVMGSALKTAVRRALPLLACMAIVPALALLTTWAENDGHLTLAAAINVANRDQLPRSHYEYVLTSLRIVLVYLRLILVPANLNLDPKIEWSTSLTDWRVLGSAAGVAGLIAGTWLVFRRRSSDLLVSMIFAFTLYYFASLITSSGLVPLPDAMAEHRAYKPSIGALVVLVCLLELVRVHFLSNGPARFALPAAAALWVAALSQGTLARNEIWRTPVSLWADTAEKSPNKWRPWFNLGCSYGEVNRIEDAERCFRKVLELEPGVMLAYSNLATILIQQGKHRDALNICRDAVARGVNTPELDHTLGAAQCFVGSVDEGIETLARVLDRRPAYRPTHIMLGAAYAFRNRQELALKHYRRAASLGPEDPALAKVIMDMENRVHRNRSRRESE